MKKRKKGKVSQFLFLTTEKNFSTKIVGDPISVLKNKIHEKEFFCRMYDYVDLKMKLLKQQK